MARSYKHLSTLTPREREVAALIAEGLFNKEIAARLCLTTHTVKTHVARALEKTGSRTRLELAVAVATRAVAVPRPWSGH